MQVLDGFGNHCVACCLDFSSCSWHPSGTGSDRIDKSDMFGQLLALWIQLSLPQAEQAEGQNRLIKLVSVGRLGPLKDLCRRKTQPALCSLWQGKQMKAIYYVQINRDKPYCSNWVCGRRRFFPPSARPSGSNSSKACFPTWKQVRK